MPDYNQGVAGIHYEKDGENVSKLTPREGEYWESVSGNCWQNSSKDNVCEITTYAKLTTTKKNFENEINQELKGTDDSGLQYKKSGDIVTQLSPRPGDIWSSVSLSCWKVAGDSASACKLTIVANPEINKKKEQKH